MNASDVINRVRIASIVEGLGGKVRHKRCQAFWRKGDGWNVSLNDDKATWFDFARGEGGGVLDLVQRIRGCTRAEALLWVADVAGIPLDAAPARREERVALARRRASAELEGKRLVEWRDLLIKMLREVRTRHLLFFHQLKASIICHGLDSPLGDVIADLCEIHERTYQHLDDDIDLLLTAPFSALLPIFRRQKRRRAA